MGQNAEIGSLQKRIGVEVIVKDEKGNVQEDVIFEDVLDTTELEWYIGVAEQHEEYSPIGDKNGNYSNEAKKDLHDARLSAQNVFETESSIELETQKIIDEAAAELKKAIGKFEQSVVRVNRTVLYNKWQEAERIVNRIIADNSKNQYSAEVFQQLEVLVEEAEELYDVNAVSQTELDSKVAALQKALDDLKASQVDQGEDDPFTEGTVSFKIMGRI